MNFDCFTPYKNMILLEEHWNKVEQNKEGQFGTGLIPPDNYSLYWQQ